MTLEERVATTAEALERSARQQGLALTGDGRLSEHDAAQLLGWAAGSLKNKRLEGSGPPAYQIGFGGGRISYRITDLAAWIEGSREIY